MQPPFSLRTFAPLALLAALVLLAADCMFRLPDRVESGPALVPIEYERVAATGRFAAPLRLIGIWRLRFEDRRLAGISALRFAGDRPVALTDSGFIVELPRPGAGARQASIRAIPGGPGDARFKSSRDSEALSRDPGGRGWWVAFEQRHSLWLFDENVSRPLQVVRLNRTGWRRNRGVEALAQGGGALVVIAESGKEILEWAGGRMRAVRLAGRIGRIADAAALPSGNLLLVERDFTLLGLRNSLVELERSSGAYTIVRRIALPLGPIDNVEALAVEPRPNGIARLWLMTDDNGQKPLRTLLIVVDWPFPAGN